MKHGFRNLLLMVGLSAVIAACVTPPAPPPPTPEVIIPATTKVLDKTAQAALETVQPNALTFAGTQPIASGDVVVSSPTTTAPDGFLRKVTAVRQENGKTILETRQAKLNEAIQEGSFDLDKQLTTADIQAVNLTPGVRIAAPDVRKTPRIGTRFDFNKVLYDKDGNLDTKEDQVTLNGFLDVNTRFKIGGKIRLGRSDTFYARAIFTENSNLTLKGKLNWAVDKKFTVGTIRFSSINFAIGPVPVHFRPIITLEVGVKGSVDGEVDVSVSQSFEATAGVEYNGEWRNISELNNNFSIDSSKLIVAANTKAYADLKFSLLFYELVEIYIRPEVFVRLDATFPRKPFLKLDGGFGVDVGIGVDLLDIDYNARIFERTYPIGQSSNQTPTATLDVPSTADLNRPVGLRASGIDLEDGANVNVTWTSSLPSDGVIGTGQVVSQAFATPGSRTITARITDLDGASITQSKVINIINTAPIVSISEPTNTSVVYKGSAYFFQANAEDINESNDQLNCANISWTTNVVSDGFSKTGCEIEAAFSSTGERILTITATDPQGLSNTKTVTINVLATPANVPPNKVKIITPSPTVNLDAVNGIVTLTGSAQDPELGAVTLEWSVASQPADAAGNPIGVFGTDIKLTLDATNQANIFTALGIDPTSTSSDFRIIRITLTASDPENNKTPTSILVKYLKPVG
jgi:hypothetical protein